MKNVITRMPTIIYTTMMPIDKFQTCCYVNLSPMVYIELFQLILGEVIFSLFYEVHEIKGGFFLYAMNKY
jgi:hypothetical protein